MRMRRTIERSLVLLAAVCLAPAFLRAQSTKPGGPPPGTFSPRGQTPPQGTPALRGFTPSSGAQGSSVTLTFTGVNFRAPVTLHISPITGINVTSVGVLNSGQIQATLQIDASAPLGPRGLMLMVADHGLEGPQPFTVTPGQQGCVPTAAGIPCPQPPNGGGQLLSILRVTPNQITAGTQNLDLKIEGKNFAPGAQVNFSAESGAIANVFPAGGTRYVNATEIHVVVNVPPSAIPGGRDVTVTNPDRSSGTGKGLIRIVAPVLRAGGSGAPPKVKLVPITFQHFSEGKIILEAPPWGDPYEGEIQMHYGIPPLNDETLFQWSEQNPGLAEYFELRIYSKDGKTVIARKRLDGSPVVVNGVQTNNPPTFYHVDPAFVAAALSNISTPLKPLLYGSSLMPSVIAQGSQAGQGQSPQQSTGFKLAQGARSGSGTVIVPVTTQPASTGSQLSVGDLQWEVAGFRTYNNDGSSKQTYMKVSGVALQSGAGAGAAPGNQTDVEVEISDRWPLSAPQAPNGLENCPSTVASGQGLQITDVGDPTVVDKSGNIIPKAVAVNDYVGDPFVLSGDFDLSRSPYATHPGQVESKCNQCFAAPVQLFQFSNLFIDWGDGHVEPLSAPPVSSANSPVESWSSNVGLSLPPCMPSKSCPYSVSHVYNYPGIYSVRVFELSDADVQQVNPSLVASSANGPGNSPYMAAMTIGRLSGAGGAISTAPSSGAPSSGSGALAAGAGAASMHLGAASSAAFNTIVSQSAPGTSGPSPSDVAKRAYMLYCNQIKVTTPEDLLADGPLHLVSIDAPDFPGHDVQKLSGGGLVKGGVMHGPVTGGAQPHPPVVSKVPVELAPGASAAPAANSGKPVLKAENPVGLLGQAGSSGPPPVAICSACDESMVATTQLHYYGRGRVRVTWHLDNGTWPVGSSGEDSEIGPSDQRSNLTRQNAGSGQAKVSPPADFTSQALTLALSGEKADHVVSVEAQVIPEPPPQLDQVIAGTLREAVAGGATAQGNTQGISTAAQAKNLLDSLAAPAGSGLPPLKVGFLSPSNHAAPGMDPVQYANAPLTKILTILPVREPNDQHVVSGGQTYEVVVSDPTQPCTFHFPVAGGGHFDVSGLQNHITRSGSTYSGTGNLIIHLATATGYTQYPPVQVQIKGWVVPDGENVQTGSFDVSPALTLDADTPGLSGTVDRLQGTAGTSANDVVTATLSVTLTDKTVRLPGSQQPQQWAGVAATLSPDGDWTKENLTLPQSLLGWTAFTIQSNHVRLDLSHHDGDAAGPTCGGGSGTDWVGVRFVDAVIVPYTMDLVSQLQKTVTDWGIVGGGICGYFSTGPFTANLGEGTVHFDSIQATAHNGTFSAQYNGMDVHVPWLNTDMTGNPQLQAGGGQEAYITFPLSGTAAPLNYPNISLKAANLQFTKAQNVGWGVQSDAQWAFSSQNKPFAGFTTKMFFGMDGRGYFANGNATQDVHLGGSSTLGDTPLELISAHMTASAAGSDILNFQFQTNFQLSEVMPTVPVQVNYSIEKSGTTYSATGPVNSPFTVEVAYPAGQPASDAKIHPVQGGANSKEYSGTVDLSQLGGPPITGEFRLGYQGGHDYWITRVTIGLGATGVPLVPVPPVMNLYAIRGGLGHNFPISAFKDAGSLSSETPSMDGSFLFMAGIRVGMPDQFTYMLDGDLTIKATGQDAGARMDFRAWLLTADTSGNGQFQGYFQYAGSNFDGRLWGHLDFLGGLASFDLGNSENNAAIDLHFGGGSWHIDAGKKEGPRIQAHFVIANANAYVMLGSDTGLAMGGDANYCLCVGDSSVASAYIKGDMDVGVQITPQPHFVGDASVGVSAGVCVSGVCVSAGLSAQVHLEALPLDMHASATLGLPWPIGDVTFSAHL